MDEILPPQVREALPGRTQEVLRAVSEIEKVDPTLSLLSLWVLNNSRDDAEYGRVLAIKAVHSTSRIAMACRLWLMGNAAGDLGVANTLLGALEAEAVAAGQWPVELGGELINFLRACLRHETPSVPAGVLSALRLAVEEGMLASVFPGAIAASLAETLGVALTPFADDDELTDLKLVQTSLREETANAVLPLAPRALEHIVLDLLDCRDVFLTALTGFDPLIDFIRRRALMDDAGVQAIRAGRPIQTFRVLAEQASTRVLQAVVSFSEAIAGVERQPDFEDVSAPDYGTQVAWAPAASVPLHLLFEENDARRAFSVLEDLIAAEGKSTRLNEVLDDLDPAVAEAVLALVSRLAQHDGRLEIVLTDPSSSDWQRTLTLGPEVLGKQTIAALMKRTRAAARARGVVVHKDHVPQANTVRQVFQAVDAMLERGVVEVSDIDDINSQRQVIYYKHGARVLGFFDDDNQPTGRARSLVDVPYDRRLAIAAVYFEDSPIGRAWRLWAGKDHLKDVDPRTAGDFLTACVVGLSGTTPGRRASTLRTWFAELMPHYPS